MTVIFVHNANQERACEILGCHGDVEDSSVIWCCHWVFHDVRVMVAPSSGVKHLFTHQGAKKL